MPFKLNADKAIGWICRRFGHVRERRGGSEITVPSPFPKKGGGQANQHKEQLWINIDKDRWHCWASEKKGTFAGLVCLLDNVSRETALAKFYEKEIASTGSMQSAIAKFASPAKHIEAESPIELPPHCDSIRKNGDFVAKQCWEYLADRGLPVAEIEKLMYCYDGPYRGYVIIPFYDRRGGLMYWQGRQAVASGPKYIGPPKEIAQKRNILYTSDWDMSGHPIFVVEGFFDAKALEIIGIHAVAVLGTVMTMAQANLVAGAGGDSVVVATDLDGAGEWAVENFRKTLHDTGITKVYRVKPYIGDDWWSLYEQIDDKQIDAARRIILSEVREWSAKKAFAERVTSALSAPESPQKAGKRPVGKSADVNIDIRNIAKKIRAR